MTANKWVLYKDEGRAVKKIKHAFSRLEFSRKIARVKNNFLSGCCKQKRIHHVLGWIPKIAK